MSHLIKQEIKIIGNGKNKFFDTLSQMLPKAKPKSLGVIIPDLNCQGMFAIVRHAQ